MKVLFVCSANICRSPTAAGVFGRLVQGENLDAMITVDSAGTHAGPMGEPPDPRAQAAATQRGIDLSAMRGREITADDFREFDYILAMDGDNYEHLQVQCPGELKHKIRRLMEFAAEHPDDEIPDPYFGAVAGFEQVLDMIEDAAAGLLREIRRHLAADRS